MDMRAWNHTLPEAPTTADLLRIISELTARISLLESVPSGTEAMKARLDAAEAANRKWAEKFEAAQERISALEQEVAGLRAENAALRKENGEVKAENAVLRRRLGIDSSNSSKPPSSDGWKSKRRVAPRRPSDKKQGGQLGHKPADGPLPKPDAVKLWVPAVRLCCGLPLDPSGAAGGEKRIVMDLPDPEPLRATAHVAGSIVCGGCGTKNVGAIPEEIPAGVSYGPGIRAFAVRLNVGDAMPLRRIARLVGDFFDGRLCAATISAFVSRAARRLLPLAARIGEAALAAPVRHLDETKIRLGKGKAWLHVCATALLTFLKVEPSRAEVFRPEGGTIVTDSLAAYVSMEGVRRGAGGAHLIREAQAVAELDGEPWGNDLAALLRACCKAANEAAAAGLSSVSADRIAELEAGYDALAASAIAAYEAMPPFSKDSSAKRKGHNLALRLVRDRACVLLHLHDTAVPFTNNEAERALRPLKSKENAAGCFRALAGAEEWAIVRTVLDTFRKLGLHWQETLTKPIEELSALLEAALGPPLDPAASPA